jgi:signal transduction histidine kinase
LKTYSLLRRITIGLTATMLVAGVSAFGWLYLKTKWTDVSLREQTLFDQAKMIASYLKLNGNNSITLNLPPRLAEAYSSPESEYHYAVRGENGQYLFDSGVAVSALPVLSRSRQKLYDYDPDGPGPLRVFGAALRTEVGQRTVFIQVEQRTRDPDYLRMAVVDEFITDGGWLEIPFMLLLLGVSIGIVKRALAPLTEISALAESIGPTNASVRLSVDQVPIEILPLVQSVNAVLDRLEQGLQQQREFNANAAHQLRTPLAVLMANVDALKEPNVANRLHADVEHMSRIVSQLLLIAQLETVSVNLDEIVDLNDAAAEIAGSFAPLALASGKSIELNRNSAPVVIRTNANAVRAALGNLIENAIKHTPAGTSVRLRVTAHPSIEVMDCGLGIPLEQRTKVFERFWRGDRNSSGAGLGLAIVDRIMKTLQGSVSCGEAPGGGALFTLTFPQAAVASQRTQVSPLAAE